MAANDIDFYFYFEYMSEEELRQYVEANPGRVNDEDSQGQTPLVAAVLAFDSAPLVQWLLSEKGADVNATDHYGFTPIHLARSLAVVNALLDGGANPTPAGQ